MGAAQAGVFLLLHGLCALGVNALTGGNYLFLEASPIGWMNRWGLWPWRGILTVLTLLTLGAEALLFYLLQEKRGWSH